MKRSHLIILSLFCIVSCKTNTELPPEKFSHAKWIVKEEKDYPYRDQMLQDLMADRKLHGISKDSLLNILGEPDRTDSLYFFYTVKQKRLGFFPLHTKTLVIRLNTDSTVQKVMIHQ